jgi:hypothetical protein
MDGKTEGCKAAHAAWECRAEDLAEWAWNRLVNRADVWGGYRPMHERGKEYRQQDGTIAKLGPTTTRPPVKQRGKVLLSKNTLVRHFRAWDAEDIVGLHSTSSDNTSLWGALDIDHHGPCSSRPELNLAAALGWYARLVGLGFAPLLIDSNGRGGYHLRTLFASPVPTPRVFAFLKWLISDYRAYGLLAPPEIFPKQPRIESGRFGNWLRLPGRHHTREYWSTVWNGSAWLEGEAAIAYMLALGADDPARVPLVCSPPQRSAWQQPTVTARQSGRDSMALDDDLSARITAYAAKLPHRAEGQGRDDVAYLFACFLIRDLQLPDDVALTWLEQWDAGNSPPKGTDRLREIIKSAHAYGKRTYGCGKRNFRRSTRQHGLREIRFSVRL